MKKDILSSLVLAVSTAFGLLQLTTCSSESPLENEFSTNNDFAQTASTRTFNPRYSTFTFRLWAEEFQTTDWQCAYIKDLYDIRISVALIDAGEHFSDSKYVIKFERDGGEYYPKNYLESRNNDCHNEPDAVTPHNWPLPITDIIVTANNVNYPLRLDDDTMNDALVVVQLIPKEYITDMTYKPRLIVAKRPLSELATEATNAFNMNIDVYFDDNDNLYYNSMEFDMGNPPVYVTLPGTEACEVIFENGTKRSLCHLPQIPLPEYDVSKYFLDDVRNYLDTLSENSSCPYKDYYKNYFIVPYTHPIYIPQ